MKVYVGNLNFQTSEDELTNLFSELGEVVSASIITDKMTGRSKGFGFVTFGDSNVGSDAISKFDGFEFNGRKIRVSEARERQERGGGGRGGFGSRTGGRR